MSWRVDSPIPVPFPGGKQMAVKSLDDLKKVLFDAYDGFADKRIKKLDKGMYFIVDDRDDGDEDARGELFLWFCQIGLKVEAVDAVTITLRGGVPESPRVAQWLEKMGAQKTAFAIEVPIQRGQEAQLAGLADAFRAITRRGARYDVKAYKYVCPRAAGALENLAKVLHAAW